MLHRELTRRETEILHMIKPTTFQDIVDEVRRDVEHSRYNAKRELRNLHNGNNSNNGNNDNSGGTSKISDEESV